MTMLIDIVNAKDNVIGTVDRRDALSVGANFRVIHVFVFNNRDELLLQGIPTGKRHAGYWGSSVAGYVYSGETYGQAAIRRMAEELGIRSNLQFCGKTKVNEGTAIKFVGLYTTSYTKKITANPSEAAAIEFLSIDDIQYLYRHGLRKFTPTFLQLFQMFFPWRT